MDNQALFNYVLNKMETLEEAVQQDGPDTYTAAEVEDMLYSLREVLIDGELKEIYYDQERDARGIIEPYPTTGRTDLGRLIYGDGALAQTWRLFMTTEGRKEASQLLNEAD